MGVRSRRPSLRDGTRCRLRLKYFPQERCNPPGSPRMSAARSIHLVLDPANDKARCVSWNEEALDRLRRSTRFELCVDDDQVSHIGQRDKALPAVEDVAVTLTAHASVLIPATSDPASGSVIAIAALMLPAATLGEVLVFHLLRTGGEDREATLYLPEHYGRSGVGYHRKFLDDDAQSVEIDAHSTVLNREVDTEITGLFEESKKFLGIFVRVGQLKCLGGHFLLRQFAYCGDDFVALGT